MAEGLDAPLYVQYTLAGSRCQWGSGAFTCTGDPVREEILLKLPTTFQLAWPPFYFRTVAIPQELFLL